MLRAPSSWDWDHLSFRHSDRRFHQTSRFPMTVVRFCLWRVKKRGVWQVCGGARVSSAMIARSRKFNKARLAKGSDHR